MSQAARLAGLTYADFLEAVRKTVGEDTPVMVTTDLHANHSAARIAACNAIIGYDTFPHVDMAERGREYQVTPGLGWITGEVDRIAPSNPDLKIPHMGWNTLDMIREHPVLERLPLGPKGRHAYLVHSYHLNASNEADVLARADYGGPVTAIVGKDTAIGTQFHPEKSQRFGLALISNFLKWKP